MSTREAARRDWSLIAPEGTGISQACLELIADTLPLIQRASRFPQKRRWTALLESMPDEMLQKLPGFLSNSKHEYAPALIHLVVAVRTLLYGDEIETNEDEFYEWTEKTALILVLEMIRRTGVFISIRLPSDPFSSEAIQYQVDPKMASDFQEALLRKCAKVTRN